MRSMDDRRAEFERMANRRTIGELLITRERPGKAFELCNSMAATKRTDQATLYMGVDMDDPCRKEYLQLAAAFDFAIMVNIPAQGEFPGAPYLWNTVARYAIAEGCDILHLLGDDVRYISEGWDEIVLREFALAEPDGFLFLYGPDGNHRGPGRDNATHPWINASYVDAVGEYVKTGFPVDGLDTWQFEVFDGVGRTRYNDDLRIDHLQWRRGRCEPDHVTTERMRWKENKQVTRKLWVEMEGERKADVKRVKKHIERIRHENQS